MTIVLRVAPPLDWHPRHLARASEWTLFVPGQPEPIAVVRTVVINGGTSYRAVTWAPRSRDRELIGYFPDGDAAAEACWRRYVDAAHAQHQVVSKMHGGRERGGPAADA